jgi:hypothetical protein
MRGIQTLPAKQRADATWGGRSIFGFLHNAQFVCSGEDTTFCLGDNLGIRRQNWHSPGAYFGCRCTTLRLTNRAFAPFRGSQTSRRKNNTKRILDHPCLLLSRPSAH